MLSTLNFTVLQMGNQIIVPYLRRVGTVRMSMSTMVTLLVQVRIKTCCAINKFVHLKV